MAEPPVPGTGADDAVVCRLVPATGGTPGPASIKGRGGRIAGSAVLSACVAVSVLVGGRLGGPSHTGHAVPRLGQAALPYGAVELGPLSRTAPVQLSLGLVGRDAAGLQRLVDSGGRVTEANYARQFGPAPGLVARARRWLSAQGFRSRWRPGDPLLQVTGNAGQVEKTFSVTLFRYRAKLNATGPASYFYAPVGPARLPATMARVVSSVAGLDDLPAAVPSIDEASSPDQTGSCSGAATPAQAGGFTPSSVTGFYNFTPLYKAGLKGQGQTVVFMETDGYDQEDLNAYASTLGLPAFDVTGPVVNRDWGTQTPISFQGCSSETMLDLEVVHAMAPQAHLAVYEAGVGSQEIFIGVIQALGQAVDQYPSAVYSLSLGWCEDNAESHQFEALFTKVEATGGSVFVASGDNGAYARGCKGHTLSIEEPADTPNATAVGGTTALVGKGSTYGQEAAWGEPYEQWGAGGGLSKYFARPSWQVGPGVSNQYSDHHRQVPDVSAIADGGTGWDTYMGGTWGVTGGTSAAAPLWAALATLTNQALSQRHLQPMGFANPAIYDIGANPGHFPAPAFHPVTQGSNLFYQATSSGWNYGTGWGTPNAAAFVDDYIAYAKDKR